jgi:ABC-type Fe3+ transport system permease subunit
MNKSGQKVIADPIFPAIIFIFILFLIGKYSEINDLFFRNVTPHALSLSEAINGVIESWWVIVGVILIAIILGFVCALITEFGFPREDEVH